jgi:hypothetical protein
LLLEADAEIVAMEDGSIRVLLTVSAELALLVETVSYAELLLLLLLEIELEVTYADEETMLEVT